MISKIESRISKLEDLQKKMQEDKKIGPIRKRVILKNLEMVRGQLDKIKKNLPQDKAAIINQYKQQKLVWKSAYQKLDQQYYKSVHSRIQGDLENQIYPKLEKLNQLLSKLGTSHSKYQELSALYRKADLEYGALADLLDSWDQDLESTDKAQIVSGLHKIKDSLRKRQPQRALKTE